MLLSYTALDVITSSMRIVFNWSLSSEIRNFSFPLRVHLSVKINRYVIQCVYWILWKVSRKWKHKRQSRTAVHRWTQKLYPPGNGLCPSFFVTIQLMLRWLLGCCPHLRRSEQGVFPEHCVHSWILLHMKFCCCCFFKHLTTRALTNYRIRQHILVGSGLELDARGIGVRLVAGVREFCLRG
jgi:hypothetical protein